MCDKNALPMLIILKSNQSFVHKGRRIVLVIYTSHTSPYILIIYQLTYLFNQIHNMEYAPLGQSHLKFYPSVPPSLSKLILFLNRYIQHFNWQWKVSC